MTAAPRPFLLRPMTAADLPAVAALEQALFPDDAWTPQMLASELASVPDGRYYLVAEAGGRIVGYAGLLAPPPSPPGPPGRRGLGRRAPRHEPGGQADVLTMAVAVDHWGRGIGSALLTALLTEAASRGCADVFLEVRADNPRAQGLYRRHGFVAVGLRRGYYQPSGTDAIVMRRLVDQAPLDQAPTDQAPIEQAESPAPLSTAPASEGSRS
jgi:[ribosomal protein S18]-alanine N-acetyltransferase